MPFANVNDISMYYEESGRREGEPLVLLHGGGGTIDDPVSSWDALLPHVEEHWRVLQIEHRGHGRTLNPHDQHTFAMIAEDVSAFIEQFGFAPAHVCGISDGGVAALHLAMTRPDLVQSLICAGTNYHVDEEFRVLFDVMQPEMIAEQHPDGAADLARRHDRGRYDGYWKDLIRQILHNNLSNLNYATADLQKIAAPALLVAGEMDPMANTQQMLDMKRNIQRAEWLIVNHAGHAVHFTHAWIVGPQIADFLKRHARHS